MSNFFRNTAFPYRERINFLESELKTALREADQNRKAALCHLATIEEKNTRIAALWKTAYGPKKEPLVKRLEDSNRFLRAENARLRNELQHATAVWTVYERRARSAPHLFEWGRHWQRQALGATLLTGPGLPIKRARVLQPAHA